MSSISFSLLKFEEWWATSIARLEFNCEVNPKEKKGKNIIWHVNIYIKSPNLYELRCRAFI